MSMQASRLVIYIVVSPVTWFVIPSEVGKMYQADGHEAPFTGWTGLWMLLPIVGIFVWFIKVHDGLRISRRLVSGALRLA